MYLGEKYINLHGSGDIISRDSWYKLFGGKHNNYDNVPVEKTGPIASHKVSNNGIDSDMTWSDVNKERFQPSNYSIKFLWIHCKKHVFVLCLPGSTSESRELFD